ncbi:F-box domain protein, partial [Aspergillus sclerotialis]
MSTSISSSTAFPQGEAFRFFFSANGHMVLCINSSRIVVLDVTSNPPIVRHELKTWRRPLSAAILDDGSVLAVASSKHQVNIYNLSSDQAKHAQVLALNDVPRTLALSPTGGVLAIAYNNGIEVYALGEGALSNERRAVRCAPVDSISFSSDGTMILGSSVDCEQNSIVTIAVPFDTETEASLPLRVIQTRLWTTQILFPETIQGYSHASLLPLHAECDGGWFLGYNSQVAAFKATRINNTNSGTTYFVNPPSDEGPQEPSPFMVPTADCRGELVALGFQECGLWLYGVPERLDIARPDSLSLESHANGINQTTGVRPSWRDNYTRLQRRIREPSILLNGYKITDMPGITAASWVRQLDSMLGSRLVAVAPGGINLPTIGEEDVPIDSGRVLILDFERSPTDGEMNEIEIEIGEAVPKILKEPNSTMDTEVELERRRTRLHRDHAPPLRVRSTTRVSRHAPSSSDNKLTQRDRALSNPSSEIEPGHSTQVPDIPYDNTQPRSRDTLQRAATAAAATRGRYNPRYSHEVNRTVHIPHESDADNWVPPPPPYTREPDAPLPEYLQQTLLPTRLEPVQRIGNTPSQIRRSLTRRLESISHDTPPRNLPTFQRLNRLNTITGSRLGGRLRRNRDAETNDQLGRRRTVLHRRAESSSQVRVTSERQTEPRAPQGPVPAAQIPTNNPPPSNQVTPAAPASNT